ncbi:1-phosphofructokinase family hexose kinase [Xylanimonas ulmi]|uniref:Carbohydrate kinase PfkB domain-containing protein n=1 Tax=Xylanimonas ulmi TaxID=228973 RepID=A0A4Q7LXR8_9MICO|nr:PfkB family carbohydrate kinase [Xylanibacterium ulmi]RZS59836.1 1-phosphofructokinase/hypothetical protein [Xylanibacterium ulmi]
MIVTLTPNPAVDLTIAADAIARGGTSVVDAASARAGGKGINVSRVLAQVGVATRAVAPVGSAEAAWFAADLAGVGHALIECDRPTRRSYALHEAAADVTSVVNERGAPLAPGEWARVLRALDAALAAGPRGDPAAALAVCGSIPPGAPDDLVARVVALGARCGAPVVVDTCGPGLLAAARAGATLVKPNRDELAEAVGDAGPLAGAAALQALGARVVIVSLGPDGLVVVPPRGPAVRARLAAPLRGNPTGAGDAAVAGAVSLLVDAPLRRALLGGEVAATTAVARRAAAWSAAAVLMPRAGELHPDHPRLERELMVEAIDRRE